MDLHDELEQLKTRFQYEISKKGRSNLTVVMQDTIRVFEGFKAALIQCKDVEERDQLIAMTKELQAFLALQSKQIAEKEGISEEQLRAQGENPNNYSPAEWRALEAMKSRIAEGGQEIRESAIRHKQGTRPNPSPAANKVKSKRRDRWLRS